jgi:hypothetical protein
MRLHHGVRMLVAGAIAAAMSVPAVPAAYASSISTGGAGGLVATNAVQSHPSGSTDWGLIGLGTAGGVTVVAVGLAAGRRRAHTAPSRATRIAS